MASPTVSNQTVTPAAMASIGSSMGLLAYAVSLAIVMACAPRHAEGSRHVVSIPWPAYVILPGALAFLPLIAIGLTIPLRKWNAAFIIGFNLTIAICTYWASELLRRDYIGKF